MDDLLNFSIISSDICFQYIFLSSQEGLFQICILYIYFYLCRLVLILPRYVADVNNKSYKGRGRLRELINSQTHIFALSLNSSCVYILITISSCNLLHNTQQARTYSCQTRSLLSCVSLFIHFCLFGSTTTHPLDTKKYKTYKQEHFFKV